MLGLAQGTRPYYILLLWGCLILALLSSCCVPSARTTFGNLVPEVAGVSVPAYERRVKKTLQLHLPGRCKGNIHQRASARGPQTPSSGCSTWAAGTKRRSEGGTF